MHGKWAIVAGFLAAFLAVSLSYALPCRASATPPSNGYIGLFADENHSVCSVVYVPGSPPAVYTMWVWCSPSDKGLQSAEFKIIYPANVIPSPHITLNPHIVASTGDLGGGTSVTFDDCQTDWVWTHQQDFNVINYNCGVIKVDDRPGSKLGVYNCTPGDPEEPLTVFDRLAINAACMMGFVTCGPSILSGVSIESSTAIRAYFDDCVGIGADPYANRFLLRANSNPLDSIRVVQVVQENNYTFALTLEKDMTDSTTYVLSAQDVYDCTESPLPFNSTIEFTFNKVVGTRLQSWAAVLHGSGVELAWELSEVDADARLIVSRSEDGVVFHDLDSGALENTGLSYTYIDYGAEPGKRYVYSVEYQVDNRRTELFTTEPIAMPAARLTLYQNRPNPFNPSTTISFSLPGECAVRLEVYDVSGRLVARLIDGERRAAGLNNVEWNGRDVSGRSSASGIYIYRLTAGKETISRKMVLLR
jgi:hypothetical protein